MPEIPTTEPVTVRAGQTIQWTRSLSDYPATDYTLRYYLSGPASITLTAAAYATTDHLITVTAEDSSAWTFGVYDWAVYAEKGSGPTLEKYFLESGQISVRTAEGKSFAKTMLDAIEAILEGRATSKNLDLVAKSLNSSSISKNPDLLMKYRQQFRQEYLNELAAERAAQGKDTGQVIRYRFRKA